MNSFSMGAIKNCICAKCTRTLYLAKQRETSRKKRKRKRRQKNAGLRREGGKKRGYNWQKFRKYVAETIPENRFFHSKHMPNKCLPMNRVNKTNENRRYNEKIRAIRTYNEITKRFEIKRKEKNRIIWDGREKSRQFFVNLFNCKSYRNSV